MFWGLCHQHFNDVVLDEYGFFDLTVFQVSLRNLIAELVGMFRIILAASVQFSVFEM